MQQEMPDFLPDRLEAGTPQYARHRRAAGGGSDSSASWGPENICREERLLAHQAAEGLRRVPGLTVHAPAGPCGPGRGAFHRTGAD